jgi:voltage-gated sodium channel
LVALCRRVTESLWFHRLVILAILLASVLVGVETYPEVVEHHEPLFAALDSIVLAVFTIEIVLRIGAYGSKPWLFFTSGWNVFDFFVTAIFYLPFVGSEVAVLRLARVLRVLRLLTAFPELQLIVGALIHSIPSMAHIGLLLFLQFYVFAVIGNVLFGHGDPEHFGNLGDAMLTLFQVITLEGWPDIMRAQENPAIAVGYFVIFILVGTMVILNLFIGVILNGFDRAQRELTALEAIERREEAELKQELAQIQSQLAELQKTLENRT